MGTLAWTCLKLLVSAAGGRAHGTEDVLCGMESAGPIAWIDVPTFWINMDAAVARAEWMRAQLKEVLSSGTCATRVPATSSKDAWRMMRGDLFFRGTKLRYPRAHTGQLELAIAHSHLRAIHTAFEQNSLPCLVLEDDTDLRAYPHTLVHANPPVTFSIARSVRAFAASLPPHWGIGQLMVLQGLGQWRSMTKVHANAVRWAAASGKAGVVALSVRKLIKARGQQCPAEAWSAGAYLVSAEAAQQFVATWPRLEGEGMGGGRAEDFALNASRACWVKNCDSPVRDGYELRPNMLADACLVHHASYGPALTEHEAALLGGAASKMQAQFDSKGSALGHVLRDRGRRWELREFVAAPPMVIAFENTTIMSNAAHPKESFLRRSSTENVLHWWRSIKQEHDSHYHAPEFK